MDANLHDYFEKARNLPLKIEVEKELGKCRIDLVEVISNARELTISEAASKPTAYKQRNYMAEVMYGNVIGILYDNYPEFMNRDEQNRPYILLAKNIRLYVKKLTESYLPNNIKTKHVKNLNAQSLFTDEEKIHVLYAGFVLDSNDWLNEFKEICVSYVNRAFADKSAWVIDLKLFRKYTSVVTYMSSTTESEQPLVSVPGNKEKKTGT